MSRKSLVLDGLMGTTFVAGIAGVSIALVKLLEDKNKGTLFEMFPFGTDTAKQVDSEHRIECLKTKLVTPCCTGSGARKGNVPCYHANDCYPAPSGKQYFRMTRGERCFLAGIGDDGISEKRFEALQDILDVVPMQYVCALEEISMHRGDGGIRLKTKLYDFEYNEYPTSVVGTACCSGTQGRRKIDLRASDFTMHAVLHELSHILSFEDSSLQMKWEAAMREDRISVSPYSRDAPKEGQWYEDIAEFGTLYAMLELLLLSGDAPKLQERSPRRWEVWQQTLAALNKTSRLATCEWLTDDVAEGPSGISAKYANASSPDPKDTARDRVEKDGGGDDAFDASDASVYEHDTDPYKEILDVGIEALPSGPLRWEDMEEDLRRQYGEATLSELHRMFVDLDEDGTGQLGDEARRPFLREIVRAEFRLQSAAKSGLQSERAGQSDATAGVAPGPVPNLLAEHWGVFATAAVLVVLGVVLFAARRRKATARSAVA